ncbi:MerR family transcriptional regulator [Pulveribacter suum]|uniref:MerR family transcriptional regulator n=1 Tax=Pulveribacter suum TaxID=2116657 RepID=A0A2P1NL86_9BURK|nr:MerR family transcriptional regulator [Pulveribacter suum]AVP57793.1 MerR family transcriptional regulator [Pulveribacter suum]
MSNALPPIPAKRYFTIGEVAQLCGVKPHVLRYWEQEFSQLRPMKRRGNRRYYQHHEVLMIRRIRELLYEQGFTIIGARNRLGELAQAARAPASTASAEMQADAGENILAATLVPSIVPLELAGQDAPGRAAAVDPALLRRELEEIRAILF